MLTTPDNLIFLHLLRDDLQKEVFHPLSRDGGESMVSWVLLLALFEDWSDIGVLPVLRHSPVLQDLSKMMESGLAMASAVSLSTQCVRLELTDNSKVGLDRQLKLLQRIYETQIIFKKILVGTSRLTVLKVTLLETRMAVR